MGRRILRFSYRSAAVVLAVIALFELTLRIIYYPSFEYMKLVETDPFRWSRLRAGAIEEIIFQSPSIKDRPPLKEIKVRVNSHHMRSREEYSRSKPGSLFRVVCLGDSITFGWDLAMESTYPYLLEDRLNSQGSTVRAQVMNAGFPSYTSRQGLIWLDRELLSFSPDAVIVQFGFNDAMYYWLRMSGPLRFSPDREVMQGRPGSWQPIEQKLTDPLTELLHMSHAGRIILASFSTLTQDKRAGTFARSRVPSRDFRDNLMEIYRLCRGSGARTILVEPWGTQEKYRAIIRAVASETGCALVSQSSIIEQALNHPGRVLEQERMRPRVQRLRARYGDEFLGSNRLYFFLVDMLHPNEVSNLLLVDRIVDALDIQCQLDKNDGPALE